MIRHVIFDWDGTLVNSFDVNHQCVNEILEDFGAPPISKEDWRRTYDPDFMKFYRERGIGASREEVILIYEAKMRDKPKPKLFDFVEDTLRWLKARKSMISIVSMSPRSLIAETLSENKLHVDNVIVGVDHRSKVSAIVNLVGLFGPQATVFVDDTAYFLEEAKKLGCVTMACLAGFSDEEKLRQAEPDFRISKIDSVQRYINLLNYREKEKLKRRGHL